MDSDEEVLEFDDSSSSGLSVEHIPVENITSHLLPNGDVNFASTIPGISSPKKRKRFTLELNPSVRKRQQTRLIKKLKAILDEYSAKVGQQAVVVVVSPEKENNNFKVFGSLPLENVVRDYKSIIVQELKNSYPDPQSQDDSTLVHLPSLVIDGVPTPIDKMTQAQLRTFIPLMLRHATGRGKPGWGRQSTRPPWWPKGVPWANVRSDVRSTEEKQKVSWTYVLREIVTNCYKYYDREDLLITSKDIDGNKEEIKESFLPRISSTATLHPALLTPEVQNHYSVFLQPADQQETASVSFIPVEAGSTLITLPDGTQAQLKALWPNEIKQEETQAVDAIANVAIATISEDNANAQRVLDSNENTAQVLPAFAEANVSASEHVVVNGENGLRIVIPLSVYESMVAQLTKAQASNSDSQKGSA